MNDSGIINVFSLVMGSGGIIAVISVIIGYFQYKKKMSIENITQERKKWRKDIRKIVDDIYLSDKENIGIQLTKLKVRINAFEIANKKMKGDYYIWKCILNIEKQIYDEKTNPEKVYNTSDFYDEKNILIFFISVMLKKDWEASKAEIKTNFVGIISNSLFVFHFISYSYIVFKYKSNIFLTFLPLILILTNLIMEKVIKRRDGNSFEDNRHLDKIVVIISIFILTIAISTGNVKKYFIFNNKPSLSVWIFFKILELLIMAIMSICYNFFYLIYIILKNGIREVYKDIEQMPIVAEEYFQNIGVNSEKIKQNYFNKTI